MSVSLFFNILLSLYITRQLGLLKESEFTMREALSVLEQEIGERSMEVGGVLTLLSHTLKSLGKHHESRFVYPVLGYICASFMGVLDRWIDGWLDGQTDR